MNLSFQLLQHQGGQISMSTMNTVANVLSKLLIVGITDTGKHFVIFLTTFSNVKNVLYNLF